MTVTVVFLVSSFVLHKINSEKNHRNEYYAEAEEAYEKKLWRNVCTVRAQCKIKCETETAK
jgi:hypothetical protein